MRKKAVIFDLDGVIVSTDEYHYRAWKRIADEEGIFFDRKINERLRGVSRMESLDILLKKASRDYSGDEKKELAEKKNDYYKDSLEELTPEHILPGSIELLSELEDMGVSMAIGSSSKNAPLIIDKIGVGHYFEAISDGNNIENSKPHPEVFLMASEMLDVMPEDCVVVEDALLGY